MRPISEWCKESVCRGEPEETFFPGVGKNPTRARKKLCANCPVKNECLEYAIIYDEDGVWAGLTKKERHHLYHIRDMLISQAKSQGVYETRLSIDELVALVRVPAPDEYYQEPQEPLLEQLMAESVPTFRVAS